MIWHCAPLDMVIKEQNSNISNGLSDEQAAERLAVYGYNELKVSKNKAVSKDFLEKLGNIIRIIFILAAIVSIISIKINDNGSILAALFMISLVFVDFIIDFSQKLLTNKAISSRIRSFECNARVLRDGKVINISSKLIVPGDIIVLETGDLIPADARIIRCNSFRCDESVLTGDDFTVNKDAGAKISANSPLNQRYNMVYSRCAVVSGNALAIVTETSSNCEINRVTANMGLQSKKIDSALQALMRISRFIGSAAIVGAVLVFIAGIVKGVPFLEILTVSSALALVAVPKNMLITLRSIFSGSLKAIARKKVICKGLPQVEALSGTTVFCMDKTVLLASGEKSLKCVSFAHEAIDCSNPDSVGDRDLPKLRALFKLAVLCCDASQNGFDAVDRAVIKSAQALGVLKQEADLAYPRVTATPFDRARRLCATINIIDGEPLAVVKGAPEEVLPRCEGCDHAAIDNRFEEMASKGLQVIALAFKKLEEAPLNSALSEVENGLTFAGLIGFADSLKKEAGSAIGELHGAGIKTVLLSGDSLAAACAVARRVGIMRGDRQAIDSRKLTIMTDEKLVENIHLYSVFARITPADKIRIVRAFKQKGETVLVTGNGVQDISALQKADIGCAMGKTGSDIERSAADIVVEDDSIVSVVDAISESRSVFDRIKRVAVFQLAFHIAILSSFVLSMLFMGGSFFSPLQLLVFNLVSVAFAAALRLQKVRHKVMSEKPKGRGETVFPLYRRVGAYLYGVLAGGAIAAAYLYGRGLTYLLSGFGPAEIGTSAAFVVLFVLLVIYSFNVSAVSVKRLFETVNLYLVGVAFLALVVILCGIYLNPAKEYIGIFLPSGAGVWMRLTLLSAIPFILGRCILFISRPFFRT